MSAHDFPLFLGIDIGGSAIKFGWGNFSQQLLFHDRIVLTDNSVKSLQSSIHTILKITDEKVGLDNISAFGLGTPGTINIKTGKLVGVNPNLPEWVNLEPSCLFPEKYRSRLFIDNDANLMALAEAKLSPQFSHVLGITLGSGIGCGFVVNGHVYHGASGYAMELGHNIVVPDGELCNCGKKGCVEAYASVSGLLNLIGKLPGSPPLSNMGEILSLAEKNVQVAKLIKHSIRYLSLVVANLAINLDADMIVFGGGVTELGSYPFDELKELILDGLTDIIKIKIIIRKAQTGNKAGVLGALYLAEQTDYSN